MQRPGDIRTVQTYSFLCNFSVIEISMTFRENQFVAMERNRLFGDTEFIANCGGLLGLFLGISFISILELVYFFTIRLICNLKMMRK